MRSLYIPNPPGVFPSLSFVTEGGTPGTSPRSSRPATGFYHPSPILPHGLHALHAPPVTSPTSRTSSAAPGAAPGAAYGSDWNPHKPPVTSRPPTAGGPDGDKESVRDGDESIFGDPDGQY